MIRSLTSGVSGLVNHQTRMDVVGNNIANVNTIAFKRSRTAFNEMLAQEVSSNSFNASYVGLGIGLNAIDVSWTQGALETTNNPTDLAISGDGFFIVRDGPRELLTRSGNFTFNRAGELITPSGLKVQGFAIDKTTGLPDMTQLSDVSIDLAAGSPPRFTSEVSVAGNLDAAMSDNGGVAPETYEMSTIVFDEQGNKYPMVFSFEKISADGADPDQFQVTVTGDPAAAPFGGASTVFTVEFGTDGLLQSVDGVATTDPAFALPTIGWDPAFVNITGADAIEIDLSGITHFRETSSVVVTDQNGTSSGKLVGFGFNLDGILELNFDNGHQVEVFQLAMGNANNIRGLETLGNNLYSATENSGIIKRGRAGVEMSADIVSGALEMSNVDLTNEFAEMIKTQRGFQAAARVIRTADELLTEIVNLKR
ncbi:MAG: flagellar hook protein FlgE [Rhodothermales bacterium]|nr:flagellar hook protein FlgE [Rhodothermales bacterium]